MAARVVPGRVAEPTLTVRVSARKARLLARALLLLAREMDANGLRPDPELETARAWLDDPATHREAYRRFAHMLEMRRSRQRKQAGRDTADVA
jgi:hypothetical protein